MPDTPAHFGPAIPQAATPSINPDVPREVAQSQSATPTGAEVFNQANLFEKIIFGLDAMGSSMNGRESALDKHDARAVQARKQAHKQGVDLINQIKSIGSVFQGVPIDQRQRMGAELEATLGASQDPNAPAISKMLQFMVASPQSVDKAANELSAINKFSQWQKAVGQGIETQNIQDPTIIEQLKEGLNGLVPSDVAVLNDRLNDDHPLKLSDEEMKAALDSPTILSSAFGMPTNTDIAKQNQIIAGSDARAAVAEQDASTQGTIAAATAQGKAEGVAKANEAIMPWDQTAYQNALKSVSTLGEDGAARQLPPSPELTAAIAAGKEGAGNILLSGKLGRTQEDALDAAARAGTKAGATQAARDRSKLIVKQQSPANSAVYNIANAPRDPSITFGVLQRAGYGVDLTPKALETLTKQRSMMESTQSEGDALVKTLDRNPNVLTVLGRASRALLSLRSNVRAVANVLGVDSSDPRLFRLDSYTDTFADLGITSAKVMSSKISLAYRIAVGNKDQGRLAVQDMDNAIRQLGDNSADATLTKTVINASVSRIVNKFRREITSTLGRPPLTEDRNAIDPATGNPTRIVGENTIVRRIAALPVSALFPTGHPDRTSMPDDLAALFRNTPRHVKDLVKAMVTERLRRNTLKQSQ